MEAAAADGKAKAAGFSTSCLESQSPFHSCHRNCGWFETWGTRFEFASLFWLSLSPVPVTARLRLVPTDFSRRGLDRDRDVDCSTGMLRTPPCTESNGQDSTECEWKPGGSCVRDAVQEMTSPRRRKRNATSRLDEAGLLMEGPPAVRLKTTPEKLHRALRSGAIAQAQSAVDRLSGQDVLRHSPGRTADAPSHAPHAGRRFVCVLPTLASRLLGRRGSG